MCTQSRDSKYIQSVVARPFDLLIRLRRNVVGLVMMRMRTRVLDPRWKWGGE